MDPLWELFELIKSKELAKGNLRGFLHVLIGRRIQRKEQLVSAGLPWRELAQTLKKLRWDIECVRELGVTPEQLPPRDRQRFWYQAIAQANVDSPEAAQAGDKFAKALTKAGYQVSPAPGQST